MNSQQTHLDNAVSVKVTFSPTQDNRFIALSSPASFAQLVDKACRAFNVDQATTALQVHYIDDEGDRISVSSDDELACALLVAAPGRTLLRLFVDTTSATSAPVTADIAPIAAAPVKQEDASEAKPASIVAVNTDQEEEEAACAQQTTGVAALLRKLAETGITDFPEKRCARVLARFNGDMDKAADVLHRCHERKQLRAMKQQKPEEHQREARTEQRQARRNERLAARLARQQSRAQSADAEEEKSSAAPAEVDALVAFMADKGLPAGRGKCVAALRRSSGDIEAAKAALLAWSTKQEQRQQKATNIEAAYAAQLAKLHEMGFGDDGSGRPNAAERLRRRNLRLLAKFDGDVEQVAQHLTARKAQNQARMAERKERREQPVPSELAPLLAQLDEKGFGAEEGSDNAERIRRRNLRLLKKLDGDVERVASIIEARQARKEARLARRAATSAC